MKIIRTLSSAHPEKCGVIVKGFFGNIIGEVKYANYGINMLEGKNGYFIIVKGKVTGAATDFYHATDQLLSDLKIIQNKIV